MLIFLYGEDTYRMREKLRDIIKHYREKHKSGLSLRNFDFQNNLRGSVFSSFKDESRQGSIFKEKKLLIINNSFSDIEFKEKFLKEASSFLESDDIILFYEQGAVNEREQFFKFLRKNAKCQEFKLLSGQKLRDWVEKKLKKYGNAIDSEALKEICVRVGGDSWRMNNEIKKLVNFKPKKIIKRRDVENLIKAKVDTDIFKTIDAIAQKDKKQALILLYKHLKEGDSPLYLLSMINYQFRNLLTVKSFIEHSVPYNVIIRRSGLHPFVVKKSYYQSRKFGFPELKKIYRNIFQVDIDIKTGKINPEIALDLLIAGI